MKIEDVIKIVIKLCHVNKNPWTIDGVQISNLKNL